MVEAMKVLDVASKNDAFRRSGFQRDGYQRSTELAGCGRIACGSKRR